ncbi:MAG: hypothetical protein ACRBCJ_05520 [Hyphomicrobiaceae bacterium]
MTEKQREEILELNNRIDDLDDPRECYALIKSRIAECRQAGEEVSDDLAMLERSLLNDCLLASQGR